MYRTQFGMIALVLLLLLFGGPASWAIEPCVKTAQKMFGACKLDVLEERKQTIANCLNISDQQARQACIGDANSAVAEETEACMDQREARIDVCDLLGEHRYDPDPLTDMSIDFVDVDDIGIGGEDGVAPNPYFNLTVGRTYVLRAGEGFEETVIVYVTDETVEIYGDEPYAQECRIVVDAVVIAELDEEGEVDYEAVEFTDDYYTQDSVGNVYYCGEVSRNFEDGILDNLDGSFLAGKNFAKGGILIKAFPVVGDAHRQEFSLGEAEDIVEYVDLMATPSAEEGGENIDFPCAPEGCLKTFDEAPLDPASTEFKYYKPGTGFVLAVGFEDGELTGEREELVCTGDSLAILSEPECGIENPVELLEDLCDLASQFCPDVE